jgi:hypothetical protein
MALLVVVSAYNEEGLLFDCVRSALDAGVDEVHVFDGAWRAGRAGPAFAGAREGASTDRTREVAEDAGAVFHPRMTLWEHQGDKRTYAFHGCGAQEGDHVLILDADERIRGQFPEELPELPFNVMLVSIGENDLPGIRKEFPYGDYSATPRPCFRGLPYEPKMECVAPAWYKWRGQVVQPYVGTASRLPVVDVLIEHYANLRDAERLEQKRAYYLEDHPTRSERVQERIHGFRFEIDGAGIRRRIAV